MPAPPATWSPQLKSLHWALFVIVAAAVTCVLIASGYERGDPLKGRFMFFHKSFGVTALASTLREAATQAYAACAQIEWANKYYRRDIGAKQLNRK